MPPETRPKENHQETTAQKDQIHMQASKKNKKPRTRDTPKYETNDIIIREDLLLDKKLLLETEPKNTVIIVDNPADNYLTRIQKYIESELPNTHVTIYQDNTPISDDHLILIPFQLYQKEYPKLANRTDRIYVNIRSTKDKKRISKYCKKHEYNCYFISNGYKIELISELKPPYINRILPRREDFGLLRGCQSFGRNHETIFSGAPHLKQNAFVIAAENNLTVPAVILTDTPDNQTEIIEALSRIPLLAEKHTTDLSEYTNRKKWIYITTHKSLLQSIWTDAFLSLREITKSVLAYDATDKKAYALSMHQLSKEVFTLFTTRDRGKLNKLLDILSDAGINLGPNAEALHKDKPAQPSESSQS
ncbi:hypothetical protein NEOKW01_1738 [Nematocida sp. AWRm80]|nr:hypothetical protein NEOKW01_1738 [Nematocida sp. AWRm80]